MRRAKRDTMWGMHNCPMGHARLTQWVNVLEDETRMLIVWCWEDIVVVVFVESDEHASWVPTFGVTRSVTRQIDHEQGR